MKRKLIVLIAAVLAVCCMAGLLSGCSVIVRNVEYIDLAGQGASAEYSFVDESLESERLYPVSKGGTMYFVSADGDDLNDGLTPETPIKTLSKRLRFRSKRAIPCFSGKAIRLSATCIIRILKVQKRIR